MSNIKLINPNNRRYLHNKFVDDRYLLAEDLNKNNEFNLEVMSKYIKNSFGSGNVFLHDESGMRFEGTKLIINRLDLFFDGIPIRIENVSITGNGKVNIAVGIQHINKETERVNDGGKIDNIENLNKVGVDMGISYLDNDVILKDPIFGDSWTSDRNQIQYQIYLGTTWNNVKDSNGSGGSERFGMSRNNLTVEKENFFTLELFTKNGNSITYETSGFLLSNRLGSKNPVLVRLENLDTQTIDGYAFTNTLNKPIETNMAIVRNDFYNVDNIEKVIQTFIDMSKGYEYVRIGNVRPDKLVTWQGWQQRIFTANFITMEEVDDVYNNIM